jgi:hypothetical protein
MTQQPDLLLIGLGDLGGVALELLARERDVGKILVGSRSKKRAEARCNLARIGAMAQGYSPDIQFLELDLTHTDETAQLIREIRPKIILCTASMMTWWLPSLFPEEQQIQLMRAGFGAWLPIHLTLQIKLMEALKEAEYAGFSLIAPYPDVVNPILGCLGMPPTAGVGNLDEIVPKIRILGAQQLGIDPDELQVSLVAHHALEAWVFGSGKGEPPPHYLRIDHHGEDVSTRVGAEKILFAPYPITGGPAWNFLSAGSAVRIVKALLVDYETRLHVPGPKGLPGGYPVMASNSGIQLNLPEELSIENAVAINERSHRYDGIERIESDGTVVFMKETVDVLSEMLGFRMETMKPKDAGEYAQELIDRFHSYARAHGLQLPTSVE